MNDIIIAPTTLQDTAPIEYIEATIEASYDGIGLRVHRSPGLPFHPVVGDTALTGITVTDPSVSNLAGVDLNNDTFNDGDTNHDGQLSAGETWQYTASHTVTQTDIDTNGGGDGNIENTVTADSAQTNPVAAVAFVAVDQRPALQVTKNAAVVDGAAIQCFNERNPGRAKKIKVVVSSEIFPPSVVAYRDGSLDTEVVRRFRDGMQWWPASTTPKPADSKHRRTRESG